MVTGNALVNFIIKRTILCLIILFCLGIGLALATMLNLSSKVLEAQALVSSESQADFILQTWAKYSDSVTSRVSKVKNVSIKHDYFLDDTSIPIPATFIIELLSNMSTVSKGNTYAIYSHYPFPWRSDRPPDPFAESALEHFNRNPQEYNYHQIVTDEDGERWWRYAQKITMTQSCVACHNSDPASPKRDWQVGDARGVLTIMQPLEQVSRTTQAGLRQASVMLVIFAVISISALGLVINRLNENTKTLEERVHERTAAISKTNEELGKKNNLIRQVFGRYLSNEVVENLLDSPKSLNLGGERRLVTILTSDLRGFTSISEKLSAEEVISILNIYLEKMANTIGKYNGTISEMMGDGLLVLFGAPTERQDDADRAVACGLAMQLDLLEINQRLKRLGFPELEMGIGINCGLVVLGNIGSEKRAKYGVVGSQVNLAFRIESFSVGGEVLVSDAMLTELHSKVTMRGEKQVKLKGVKEKVTLHIIEGIEGTYNLKLPEQIELFTPLAQPVRIRFISLDGKHVDEAEIAQAGLVIASSEKSARVQLTAENSVEIPPVLTNLQIEQVEVADHADEIYAKVVEVDPAHRQFTIRFTAGRLVV